MADRTIDDCDRFMELLAGNEIRTVGLDEFPFQKPEVTSEPLEQPFGLKETHPLAINYTTHQEIGEAEKVGDSFEIELLSTKDQTTNEEITGIFTDQPDQSFETQVATCSEPEEENIHEKQVPQDLLAQCIWIIWGLSNQTFQLLEGKESYRSDMARKLALRCLWRQFFSTIKTSLKFCSHNQTEIFKNSSERYAACKAVFDEYLKPFSHEEAFVSWYAITYKSLFGKKEIENHLVNISPIDKDVSLDNLRLYQMMSHTGYKEFAESIRRSPIIRASKTLYEKDEEFQEEFWKEILKPTPKEMKKKMVIFDRIDLIGKVFNEISLIEL